MGQPLPMPTVELWDFMQGLSDRGDLGDFLDRGESMLSLLKNRASNRFSPDAPEVEEALKTKARELLDKYPQIKTKWLDKRETTDWTREQRGKSLEGITRSMLAQIRKDTEKLEKEGRLHTYKWVNDPAVEKLKDQKFKQHFPDAKPGNPVVVGVLIGMAIGSGVVLVACYFFCSKKKAQ